MAHGDRDIGLITLRRFLRGEASKKELWRLLHRLEVSRTEALLEGLSLEPRFFQETKVAFREVARRLELHLHGRLDRERLRAWLTSLQQLLTSQSNGVSPKVMEAHAFAAPAVVPPTVPSAIFPIVAILTLLLSGDYPTPAHKVRRSLIRVMGWLREGKPVPARTFLSRIFSHIFRDMERVDLCRLANPVEFLAPSQDQWVDVGLRSRGQTPEPNLTGCEGSPPRVIPFSVFTRHFFERELPALMARIDGEAPWDRTHADAFLYHPENDQAISLKERFPRLRGLRPSFSYYLDGGGLAEIVLDASRIGRAELVFATRLFCVKNGLRNAFLDGVRMRH